MRDGLASGVIDCVGTDHAPHAGHEKHVEYAEAAPGISGLETAFGALMQLVHDGEISLPRLDPAPDSAELRCLPACPTAPSLVGAAGDVVVLDPEREWVVDAAAFRSRGKNSPFHGLTFRGRVLKTICDGRIVFDLNEESVETVGALGI